MKSVWKELCWVKMLLRIGNTQKSTNSIYTLLRNTYSFIFFYVLIISHRYNVDFSMFICYCILAEAEQSKQTEFAFELAYLTVRKLHTHPAGKFPCDSTLREIPLWSLCLANKDCELAAQWHVVLTGLAQSKKRFFWVALMERTKNPENARRVASHHSPPQLRSHLRSRRCCWFRQLCVCRCAFVYATQSHRFSQASWSAATHTISQLHPTEVLLLLGAAAESRYETWHHGGRLTKTIRAAWWTSHTSTFSLFLSLLLQHSN